MANVLITGINGFIGRNLAADQLARGHSVIGLVKPGNRMQVDRCLRSCTLIDANIMDYEAVRRIIFHS